MNKKQYTREEVIQSTPRTGFFGHPKGLSTLFFTEFWERFSYYGMKAILVYYLYYSVAKGGFGLDESVAMQIVALYGTLIYMSGVIGGWIADRITGTQHAVFFGGILIMFGHFTGQPNRRYDCFITLDYRDRFVKTKHFYNSRRIIR